MQPVMLTSVVVSVGFETTTSVFVLALVDVPVAGAVGGGDAGWSAGGDEPASESRRRSVRAPQAAAARVWARTGSRSARIGVL